MGALWIKLILNLNLNLGSAVTCASDGEQQRGQQLGRRRRAQESLRQQGRHQRRRVEDQLHRGAVQASPSLSLGLRCAHLPSPCNHAPRRDFNLHDYCTCPAKKAAQKSTWSCNSRTCPPSAEHPPHVFWIQGFMHLNPEIPNPKCPDLAAAHGRPCAVHAV